MSAYRKLLERMMSRERYAINEAILRDETLKFDPELRATCLSAIELHKSLPLSTRTAASVIHSMETGPLLPLLTMLEETDKHFGDTRCNERCRSLQTLQKDLSDAIDLLETDTDGLGDRERQEQARCVTRMRDDAKPYLSAQVDSDEIQNGLYRLINLARACRGQFAGAPTAEVTT